MFGCFEIYLEMKLLILSQNNEVCKIINGHKRPIVTFDRMASFSLTYKLYKGFYY